jgi:hypothetical protein
MKLTPEQQRQAVFARRKFDPESYEKEILGPEPSPTLQVAIAAGDLAEIDNPSQPTQQSLEMLDYWKAKADKAAEEFAFLDPEDYADEKARRGRVLTPQEFLTILRDKCGLECWFSLGSEALVAKELNPRDVALAKLKIGDNPENLYNVQRWRDAIAEVRQEEAKKVPMRDYELFALQICRSPGKPEYACWLPGCHLREYDLVQFDSHKVPTQVIRGWRTALIEIVRKRFLTEAEVTAAFGEATGHVAKRYLMIMQGLRSTPDEGDEPIQTQENPVGRKDDECGTDVGRGRTAGHGTKANPVARGQRKPAKHARKHAGAAEQAGSASSDSAQSGEAAARRREHAPITDHRVPAQERRHGLIWLP